MHRAVRVAANRLSPANPARDPGHGNRGPIASFIRGARWTQIRTQDFRRFENRHDAQPRGAGRSVRLSHSPPVTGNPPARRSSDRAPHPRRAAHRHERGRTRTTDGTPGTACGAGRGESVIAHQPARASPGSRSAPGIDPHPFIRAARRRATRRRSNGRRRRKTSLATPCPLERAGRRTRVTRERQPFSFLRPPRPALHAGPKTQWPDRRAESARLSRPVDTPTMAVPGVGERKPLARRIGHRAGAAGRSGRVIDSNSISPRLRPLIRGAGRPPIPAIQPGKEARGK